jgi:ABC-type multidrug transport system fused ATPase/permease subunit
MICDRISICRGTKISENIGLGDPEHANDEDKIREAAKLGGAEEFIDRLPEAFETFLSRPVQDYYSELPEGTKTLFGRVVEYNRIRQVSGLKTTSGMTLSGGQMQRLALYAIFTAHMVSD